MPRARLLLVDDEPSLTAGLRLALRREPFEISTANSGEEALERLTRETFDAIVSDERMPGMQGSELLSTVRDRWPETQRVILSGQSSLESAVRAINAAGIHRFLLKPCPAEEVALVLHELLDARAEAAAAEALRAGPRLELSAAFDRALEGLWMALQPVYRVDGTLFAHEALVRAESESLRSPSALLTAADELGRGQDLARAIRGAVAARIGEAPEGTSVLVNVDTGDLADPALYAADSALAAHAARVILEITERRPLGEAHEVETQLDRLRALGFRIALDDLGAGYAGLNHLTRLSPDVVKFDMELVRGIDRSPTKRAILESMTGLARKMGMLTIAEGIERESEREVVVALGCDLLQGYLLGAPQRDFVGAPEARRAAA